MKSFRGFIDEEGGAAPVTSSEGIKSSVDNPPGPKRRKQHSESVPYGNNFGTVPGDVIPLTPVIIDKKGNRKELGEDTKEEQKKRIKTSGGIDNPFSKKHKEAIEKELAEESKDLPRDADGKMITPEREERGGFWSSHKHPEGELEWFPRKNVIKVGEKTWTRNAPDTPTPKPKRDIGKTHKKASEVLGDQQKIIAQRKQEEKALKELIKKRSQEVRLANLNKKIEKEKSTTLREKLLKDKK